MNEEIIQSLRNISYYFGKNNSISESHIVSIDKISLDLNNIKDSLDLINTNLNTYYSSITNQPWFHFIIGSIVTFFATWLFEKIKSHRDQKQYLYYQYRTIIEQINMIVEVENTIFNFLDNKVTELIKHIEDNPDTAWSADTAYFPLFSVRSLPEKIVMKSSGSGYLDNKISKIYSMSKDLPHIIKDLRFQFEATIKTNERIVYGKLNSPQVQKAQFKRNLTEYECAIRKEMLNKNIPLYIKKLAETAVAIQEKIKIGSLRWKFKFDPRYKFHMSRKTVIKDIENLMRNMDYDFKSKTDNLLDEIDNGRNKQCASSKFYQSSD